MVIGIITIDDANDRKGSTTMNDLMKIAYYLRIC